MWHPTAPDEYVLSQQCSRSSRLNGEEIAHKSPSAPNVSTTDEFGAKIMATRLIGVEISTNDDLLIKLPLHG